MLLISVLDVSSCFQLGVYVFGVWSWGLLSMPVLGAASALDVCNECC